MRVNIVNQGNQGGGGFDIAGATLTGPLILAADPVVALEASTKQYIDNAVNSLNASHISTGTLAVGRLPAFTGGEITTIQGSNVMSLGNTTVTPGTYTKVTVDAKGRVTNGSNLVSADIPNLDFSKFTANKPTTLSGYGITDAVKNTNDSVTGFVSAHAAPTSNNHAATKGYVDSIVSGSSTLNTGDTIRRTTTTTPTGFLRCNGGQVNKATYPALYAAIGDKYSYNSLTPGAGAPWYNQYSDNVSSLTDVGVWTVETSKLPAARGSSSAVVTKNRVYLINGGNGTSYGSASIYTAPIDANGNIGTWSDAGATPTATYHSSVVVTKNRVILIGGTSTADSSVKLTNTYSCPINADGTLAAWGWVAGPNLPVGCDEGQAFVVNGKLYYFSANSIYVSNINADGTIGAWSVHATTPIHFNTPQLVVTKNYLHVVSGNLSNTNVYSAPIDSNGVLGTLVATGTFPMARYQSVSAVTRNRVFVFGGWTSGTAHKTCYSAPINPDGTLGTWVAISNLYDPVAYAQCVVTSSKIYILGGFINVGSQTANVYSASFSGGLNDYTAYYDGTITPTDTNNFGLPDTSRTDVNGVYTYIKT